MYPFAEGSFAVRNGWYVAAFANEVGRALLPRTILNEPVVLYRKEDGEAVAIGGRCPHRHFPLGSSRLEGDAVVCGYHGIAFGPDGRCARIPSQAHIPAAVKVPGYPLIEHGVWLWIWMGDPAAADPALLPPIEEILPGGLHAEPLFFHEIACRYQLMNDNLLDLTHLGYLHGKTIGVPKNAEVPEALTAGERLLRSRREINDYRPSDMQAQIWRHAGLVDSIIEFVFYAPGFHSGVGDHFVSRTDEERPGAVLRIARTLHAVTPSTPARTYYFFAISGSAEDIAVARDRLGEVIQEDIFASEEIEKMLAVVGGSPKELMLRSDANAVAGRRMLQALMDAEAASEVGGKGEAESIALARPLGLASR